MTLECKGTFTILGDFLHCKLELACVEIYVGLYT